MALVRDMGQAPTPRRARPGRADLSGRACAADPSNARARAGVQALRLLASMPPLRSTRAAWWYAALPPLLRTRLAAPRAARAGISSRGSRRFIRVPGPSRAQRLCPPCARVRTDPANPSVRLSQIAMGSESEFCHAGSRLRGGRLFEAPEHQEAFPPHPCVIDTLRG